MGAARLRAQRGRRSRLLRSVLGAVVGPQCPGRLARGWRASNGQGCSWLPLSPCLSPPWGRPHTGPLSPTKGPWGAQLCLRVNRKGRVVCPSGTSLCPWVQGGLAGHAFAWLRACALQGHPCSHSPGPACSPLGPFLPEFVALRLENSDGCSGRLQVFYNGTWGIVCSNSMTPKTVSLACKLLGCGDRGSLETRLPSGKVSGPAWLDRVECGERNNFFWQCPSTPWDPQSCDDLRDETHITCNGNSELARHQHPPSPCSLLGIVKSRDRAHRGFYFTCQTLLLLVAQTRLQLSEPHTFTSSCQPGS